MCNNLYYCVNLESRNHHEVMATVNLKHHFWSEEIDEEKEYPIVFLIRNYKTHSHINTGIKLKKKYFDKDKWIKKNAPGIINHIKKNAELQQKLADIQTFIIELTNTGEIRSMSAAAIKKRYEDSREKEKYNFTTYYKYCINTKKADKTKSVYEYTLKLIEEYSPGEIRFSDVNVRFLREFELWMIDKEMKVNSISIHMRNIRTVFNMAIDDDVVDLSLYPFRKFKIKSEKTVKRNLTIDEIRRLLDVNLSGVPRLSRDVFMLSFYLIGINLIDLVHLRKENIKAGRLEYKRRKTGKGYTVKLEPEAKKLIKKLSGTKYLINTLERYIDYPGAIKYIDKGLKKAAKQAKIDKPISTYYCRHSWATIASNLDIPKETISAALGHEIGSKVTGIYIDYDQSKVDQANRKVIDSIHS